MSEAEHTRPLYSLDPVAVLLRGMHRKSAGTDKPPAGYHFLTDENYKLLLDEAGAYLIDKEGQING